MSDPYRDDPRRQTDAGTWNSTAQAYVSKHGQVVETAEEIESRGPRPLASAVPSSLFRCIVCGVEVRLYEGTNFEPTCKCTGLPGGVFRQVST